MKFFTAVFAALSFSSVIAAPVEKRGVQVGAVNSILSTMDTTLAQNAKTSNDIIYQMRVIGADELRLAQAMIQGLADASDTLADGGSQIASSLANAGTTLSAPAIATFTSDFKYATSLFKSTLATFQAEAAASQASFSAATQKVVAQEYAVAMAALQPFVNPMLAYAQSIKSNGDASGAASLAALQSVISGCQVLVASVNQILGVSTD